jgi:hypothetical protein
VSACEGCRVLTEVWWIEPKSTLYTLTSKCDMTHAAACVISKKRLRKPRVTIYARCGNKAARINLQVKLVFPPRLNGGFICHLSKAVQRRVQRRARHITRIAKSIIFIIECVRAKWHVLMTRHCFQSTLSSRRKRKTNKSKNIYALKIKIVPFQPFDTFGVYILVLCLLQTLI